ncbi:hypothetical protein WOLCODRAFT_140539 [Wolfiporia cocos MD-104 SS10]|uniref:Uncharacterized protein n=1 Tax=Wolfiporia cocos (strain MD-104) TaxID=742152 RepID=A0A2H3JG13_WOLCO|nr:hypothetical protein WOLCODRAFT_140539 [Wolfiporia cocos MD-104 SS10]
MPLRTSTSVSASAKSIANHIGWKKAVAVPTLAPLVRPLWASVSAAHSLPSPSPSSVRTSPTAGWTTIRLRATTGSPS